MNRTSIISIAVFLVVLISTLPLTAATSYSLTYDANGNLITGDGKYRVYDSFNHLVKLYNGSDTTGTLLQEYVYHPTEDRILLKKTYNASGSSIENITYVSDEFLRITNTSGTYNTTYVMANDHQIAQIQPDGTTQYLLTDIEGSVTVTTNSSGNVTERTTYTPYGDVFSGGNKTRFDYEGREADSISGDTDFRFRKYKPTWGLFTQPDNAISDVYDPQSLNRYAFERNNPARYQDPTGHMDEELYNPQIYEEQLRVQQGRAAYWQDERERVTYAADAGGAIALDAMAQRRIIGANPWEHNIPGMPNSPRNIYAANVRLPPLARNPVFVFYDYVNPFHGSGTDSSGIPQATYAIPPYSPATVSLAGGAAVGSTSGGRSGSGYVFDITSGGQGGNYGFGESTGRVVFYHPKAQASKGSWSGGTKKYSNPWSSVKKR